MPRLWETKSFIVAILSSSKITLKSFKERLTLFKLDSKRVVVWLLVERRIKFSFFKSFILMILLLAKWFSLAKTATKLSVSKSKELYFLEGITPSTMAKSISYDCNLS